MALGSYHLPLKFVQSADVVLVANVASTILNLTSADFSFGVRIVPSGGNIRVAVGRDAIATDPLVMSGEEIFLDLAPGVAQIVSVISTSTPTVNAATFTR